MEGWHSDRRANLEEVIRELERRFGPGIVYRLSQAKPKVGEVALSTGSLALDYATGLGGVPRGRITEIYGPDSSGKTTLAYQLLASAQRDQGLAVLIDAEQAADGEAMTSCGVDLSDLILASPVEAEEGLEMVEILVRCGALDALVVSSVAALGALPRRVSSLARLMSEGLSKINLFLKGTPTALVFTNHLSQPGQRPAGGRALGFYASLRIELQAQRPITRFDGDVVGVRALAKVTKNKMAFPLREVTLDFLEGKGISHEGELVDLGLERGLIKKLPLGLVYDFEVLGRGREQALAFLRQNAAVTRRLEEDLRRQLMDTAPLSMSA